MNEGRMTGTTTSRERQRLIDNEQTKRVANALDRASTAVGVGSIFPWVGSRLSLFPYSERPCYILQRVEL
jgi:hypothetical protein